LTPQGIAPQVRREPEKSTRFEADTPSVGLGGDGEEMAESVYKVIELIGTSSESWEKAAAAAIERAAMSLRDLRIAEVLEQDLVIENGKVEAYRTKLKVSFKYESLD
jgi:flavin-binding protein dodecin